MPRRLEWRSGSRSARPWPATAFMPVWHSGVSTARTETRIRHKPPTTLPATAAIPPGASTNHEEIPRRLPAQAHPSVSGAVGTDRTGCRGQPAFPQPGPRRARHGCARPPRMARNRHRNAPRTRLAVRRPGHRAPADRGQARAGGSRNPRVHSPPSCPTRTLRGSGSRRYEHPIRIFEVGGVKLPWHGVIKTAALPAIEESIALTEAAAPRRCARPKRRFAAPFQTPRRSPPARGRGCTISPEPGMPRSLARIDPNHESRLKGASIR